MSVLAGLTVVDLSRMLPGAVVTRQLLDLGARVLKVEQPDGGDPMRQVPPLVDGIGLPFAVLLAGSESVTLDLRTGDGRDRLRTLLGRSDIVLESFRPGTLATWDLTPDSLLAASPRLVGCSLPSHGGGDDRIAHDLNLVAEAGALELLPGDGLPLVQLADVGAGLLATTAILAARLAVERTGRGRWLEQPLASGVRPFTTWAAAEAALGRERVLAVLLGGGLPCYRLYACGDDERLAVAALEPKFWVGFTAMLGLEELAGAAFALGEESEQAVTRIEARLATRPAAEWEAEARAAGLPVNRVADLDRAATGWPVALPDGGGISVPGPWLPDLALATDRPAPALGADTERVLAELT